MRPMTNPPLLSPSPCPLLRRLLHLSRASRRRNPTAGPPPPCTFRHRLPRLLTAAMSSDSVVADPTTLARKVADIRAAGPAKLQVIADFDGTLTRYWYDGARGQSSHGLLRQGNEEYDAKREALYQHYHPIEICPDIPLPEKAKLMEEWWEKTHGLLIEGGLTLEDITKSVSDAAIAFREGVVELFEYLEERDIPVLVFSAGLADIIEEVFRQKLHKSFKNIKIVSNRMVFNEEGRLVAFKGKTIHVLNKNEHALDMAAPVHGNLGDPNGFIDDYSLVKKRTNVLLLGDHIRFSLTFHFGEYRRRRLPHRYFRDEDISRCLEYAAACDAEDLNLDIADHFMSTGSMLRFPPACPRLARLSLLHVGYVTFDYSLRSDAYAALEVVQIHSARSVDINQLLPACPRLRTLDLRACKFLDEIYATSPQGRLRSLTVAECNRVTHLYAGLASGLRSFRLSSALLPIYEIAATAQLDDLYICLRGPCVRYPLKHWIQALPNLANLTVLTICSIALRRIYALARFGSATCLTRLRKLPSLKELQLLMFEMKSSNLAHIYMFLQTCRCPKLERLFVQLPSSSSDTFVGNSLEVAEEDDSEGRHSEEDVTEDDEPDKELSEEEDTESDEPEEELSEEDVTEDELLQEELVQEYMLKERPYYEDVYEEDILGEDVPEEDYFEEDEPEYDFGNLMFVRMMKFKGHYFELRLVSFLLRKATGLKKLLLVAPKGNLMDRVGNDHVDLSPFVETKQLPFRRASPNVQIILSKCDSAGIQPVHAEIFSNF